ncbi:hypothetical protein Tco_1355341 [Tanacetum coccineum]
MILVLEGYGSSDYFYFFRHISSISIEIPVAPEVRVVAVASPAGVLKLDTHSSSKADSSDRSPPPVSVVAMVLLFPCSDESESDTKIPERHVSPTTSTPEIPTAPILPAPSAIVAPSSEFPLAPGIDHEEFDHSSSGHSISGHSLSRHTPPDTTDDDSSTPPRFVHPSLARTSQRSEAYLRWSSLDDTVTSPIHVTRTLVPSRADLLPPRKRFRDSISPEDSVEENIDTDVLVDIKADVTVVEVVVDRDVKAGIDANIGMEVDVGVDVEDEVEDEVESSGRGTMEVRVDMVAGIDIHHAMLMPDVVERLEQVEEGLQDIYDHVIEIPLQRIEDIKTGQRELEARSLIVGGERASLLDQVASLERSNTRLRGTMMMERARADRFRRRMRFMESEIRQICRFRYYDIMRFRRLDTFTMRCLGFRP